MDFTGIKKFQMSQKRVVEPHIKDSTLNVCPTSSKIALGNVDIVDVSYEKDMKI